MKIAWDKEKLAMAIQCKSEVEFNELREILSNQLDVTWEIYEE